MTRRCGYDERCGRFHVLGCPGHPFHPDYGRWLDEEQLKLSRVEGTKNLYVACMIDDKEMERRIELAVAGGALEGDPGQP